MATCSIFRRMRRGPTARRSGVPIKRGAALANPCFTQIHPTCIPVSGEYQSKLTLMSESLRNDGRIWVPKKKGDTRPPRSDSGRRARLLPRTKISELRKPGSARRRFPQCKVGLRRRPRRRRRRSGRLPGFLRMQSDGWASTASANAMEICSTCMNESRAKIRTKFRCGFIPRSTTRWAASGSTTT